MRWVLTACLTLLLATSSVLGQTDGDEVEVDPLREALAAECTTIERLPSGTAVLVESDRRWDELDAQRKQLEKDLSREREELGATLTRDGRPSERQLSVIEDLEYQLTAIRAMQVVVDECSTRRYAELVRQLGAETDPGVLRASWDEATCTDTPGVEMAREGALDLTLEDGGVSGVTRWIFEPEQKGENAGEEAESREISLEVMGAYELDGAIRLMLVRPEALDEFHVRGQVEFTPMGLRGSGEIRYGVTVEGCNIGPDPNVCVHPISCSGRWKSHTEPSR
jgi:hypothetical protein